MTEISDSNIGKSSMNRLKIITISIFVAVLFASSVYASDNILKGHVPVSELSYNFENKNWLNDQYRGNDDHYWHDPPINENPRYQKIGIQHKEWIATPLGGKPDSFGALEIGRINDPTQQEMLSPTFAKKREILKRSDMPVFIVRVYLPPFNKYYGFGFRHWTSTKEAKYSTSIWVKNNNKGAHFYFRANNGQEDDVPGGPSVEPGWWTWAIAFDNKGVGYYYISKGTNIPNKNDEVYNTSKFPAQNNPQIDEIEYSFFAISGGDEDSKFVIDDYEVWVAK